MVATLGRGAPQRARRRHFIVDARLAATDGAKFAALPTDHLMSCVGVYVVLDMILPATRGNS